MCRMHGTHSKYTTKKKSRALLEQLGLLDPCVLVLEHQGAPEAEQSLLECTLFLHDLPDMEMITFHLNVNGETTPQGLCNM